MNTYLLGSGLPDGLTPKRIKDILTFVKSQVREFEDALNHIGGPIWKKNSNDQGFYECIHFLLRTEAGRAEYSRAKNHFEQSKPKRKGRADFFSRLKLDCLKSLSQHDSMFSEGGTVNGLLDEPHKSYLAFARSNAWESMAQFVWAHCVESRSGDDIANMLKQYPQLSSFLSKVDVIPDSNAKDSKVADDQPPEELPGEVERLIEGISEAVQSLEPTRLDLKLLTEVIEKVSRLATISDVRETRARNSNTLKSCIAKWQECNSEEISNTPELTERIVKLNSSIEYSGISIDELKASLTDFQELIGMTQRMKELKDRCRQAIDNSDSESLSSMTNEWKILEQKTSVHLEMIDKKLKRLDWNAPTDVSSDVSTVTAHHTAQVERAEAQPADTESFVEKDSVSRINRDENYTKVSLQHETGLREAATDTAASTKETGTSDSEFNKRVHDTIAREISNGRYAFAYHLAQSDPGLFPTPSVIKLIASNYVHRDSLALSTQFPTITNDISDDLTVIKNNNDDFPPSATLALIASAALAPARISTGGPVSQLLLDLEPFLKEQKSFWGIVKKAAEVSLNGIQLSSVFFSDGNKEEHWRGHFQNLSKETSEWLSVELRSTIKYKPATDVWRHILEKWNHNGRDSLGLLLSKFQFERSTIPKNLPNVDIEKVKSSSDRWRQEIEREIDRIDRECRKITKFKPIEGSARVALRSKILEALGLIDRWCAIFSTRPNLDSNYHLRQVEDLRGIIYQHWRAATKEISELGSEYKDRTCDLFYQYIAFFGVDVNTTQALDLGIDDLLHGELLADEDFELDHISGTPNEAVSANKILTLLSQDQLDFKGSAITKAKRHDFHGAELTIDFAVRRGIFSEHEEDIVRLAIDELRKLSVDSLEQQVASVNARLGTAYARGVIPTKDFEDLQSQALPPDFTFAEDRGDLRQLFCRLKRIDDAIEGFKNIRVAELRRNLANLTDLLNAQDRERIDSAISEDRYLVAEDFLDRAAQGKSLPDLGTSQQRSFDRFFPIFVEKYSKLYEDQSRSFDQIVDMVKHKKHFDPVDATNLSTSAVRNSMDLLVNWLGLLDDQPIKENNIVSLFSCLGFSKPTVIKPLELLRPKGPKSHDEFNAQIKTGIIADRRISQLPEFGSHAAGNYRLLIIRNCNVCQEIIQNIDASSEVGSPPLIVVFLNRLDTSERRSLASQLAFGGHGPTLVLDEALIVFLALEPAKSRLRAFFDCTSAFTFASPYNPDAASVPLEMFFGRADARRRIRSLNDASHLVFGGRRLGKTALLKSIESEFSMRSKDEIVLYLDLNGTGIGQHRSVDDIWTVLAIGLSKQIVILKDEKRADRIRTKIKAWIEQRSNRRLLILLDEADNFLESDRLHKHKYRVLSQIKNLMDQTERRFKVVFSGLHNVQRSSRDPNTPLAHLGTPIQIGPMLPGRDHFEFENLIRQPLEALGYRFESNDDVTHIAIETNYYPALAQQFCKELLVHLREGRIPNKGEGPPYTIPSATIRHVFDSKETRDRLRNIFSWTIQLDPRYEFFTYLIARVSLKDEESRALGVSLSEIRSIALSEWPGGFLTDPSNTTFEVLLEEMIGLGVLRETSPGSFVNFLDAHAEQSQDRRFSIRTRSLRVLLGNDAEVERRYEDSKTRKIPTFDSSRFRRTINNIEIAPLTAAQEELLLFDQLYVGLVFGTKLSGLDQVRESLCQAANEMEGAPNIEFVEEKKLLFARLSKISRGQRKSSVVLIVELHDSLNLEVIIRAKETVERLDARNKRVRVIFLCRPLVAWDWHIKSVPISYSGLKTTWLSRCSSDFAHLWLKEKEIPAFSEFEDVDLVHKPWPAVLSIAAKFKLSSLRSAEKETLDEHPNLVSDVLEVPIAKTVLKAWSESDLDSAETIDSIHYWLREYISETGERTENFYTIEDMERVVEWAMRLGVVHKAADGYILDPTYLDGIRLISRT